MPARKSADGAVANLVRPGREQPQRFGAGSSASTFHTHESSATLHSGVHVTDFEYFIAFFSVMLGLVVAELAVKFADAIDAHRRKPIGLLTPLLAIFLLLDVTSFWLWIWSVRDIVIVTWPTIFGSVIVAVAYFLSAALVFPRRENAAESLDQHYFERKRFVLAGVLFANLVILALVMSISVPALTDFWAWFWLGIYYVPLSLLWFVRSRRANMALLVILIAQYLAQSLPVPTSQWGNQIGINGDQAKASTETATAPK